MSDTSKHVSFQVSVRCQLESWWITVHLHMLMQNAHFEALLTHTFLPYSFLLLAAQRHLCSRNKSRWQHDHISEWGVFHGASHQRQTSVWDAGRQGHIGVSFSWWGCLGDQLQARCLVSPPVDTADPDAWVGDCHGGGFINMKFWFQKSIVVNCLYLSWWNFSS